jgi:hypothetical protein
LSDSEKNTSSATDYLFDNEYVYVTEEGDLYLKKTSHFDARKIAELDAEKLDEQMQIYIRKYQTLEEKADQILQDAKEAGSEQFNDAESQLREFRNELLDADVIGDLKSLIDKVDKVLVEVKDKFKTEKDNDAAVVPNSSEPAKKEESVNEETPVSRTTGNEESDTSEEPSKDKNGEEQGEDENAEEYFRNLAEKTEQLVELTDWPYVTMEFANIDTLWEEGPDPGEIDINEYRQRIDRAKENFERRKVEHYEEQKRIKAENLEKKAALLEELKKIVTDENWTATREVNKIKSKWDQIKPLPSGKAEEFQGVFDKLIAEFENHKVDRLVRKKQKEEENLIGKLAVLDKLDGLLKSLDKEGIDWKTAERELEKLNKQWRKIGRVPIEKNQEMWDRYHGIQDRFHELRFKNDKKYRQRIEKFLSRKKQLIKEAEALIDDPNLASAARKVNKLHRRWKKVGNLPQKDENELWDQFKAATDEFNEKKSENVDKLHEQEDKNLEEKKKLIREAEALTDSEEWEATHNKLQQLMKKWKEIGPVPKRKSGKIWKKFKGAMDVFYDRRREYFKEVKEDRKENFEEKQEILKKLKELINHENPIKAVEIAKPLQEEFKKAGYVPIKYKNKMWKEYRETCDVIYDRFRAAKSAADIVGKENVADYSADDIAEIQKKQKEASRLRKEINKTHNELIQMKESLSYFKPSGKGSSLLDEVHKKIEKAEEEIEQKETKLAELEKDIDLLTRDS